MSTVALALVAVVVLVGIAEAFLRGRIERWRNAWRMARGRNDSASISLKQDVLQGIAACAERLAPYPEFRNTVRMLLDVVDDYKRPLLVVVMGQFKTGKSTFINALLNEDMLRVDVTPTTAVVTIIQYGDKPGLTAVYEDRTRNFPVSALPRLSAETAEDGARLRENLRYVELRLPNPLLKRFTIVDTPGLNSQHVLHTQATKEFMSRADVVFWVFAYGYVGTATELSTIGELGAELRPIAVVNRIDEHDPEEGPLEDVLDNMRRRLGNVVSEVIAVSAAHARLAMKNGDDELMKQSNWSQVEKVIRELSGESSRARKRRRLAERLNAARQEALSILEQLEARLYEAAANVREWEEKIGRMQDTRNKARSLLHDWQLSIGRHPIDLIASNAPLPAFVVDSGRLNLVLESLKELVTELQSESAELDVAWESFNHRWRQHAAEMKRWERAYKEWSNSGLFGPPILERLFGIGRARELKEWQERLVQREASLKVEEADLRARTEACLTRRQRANSEARTVIDEVRASIVETIQRLETEIRAARQNVKIARRHYESLDWIRDVSNVVRYELGELISLFAQKADATLDVVA